MKLLKYVLMLLAVVSCSQNNISLDDFNIEVYKPSYANGFKILGAENSQSTIIEINNPWQGAQNVTTKLFIARNNENVPHGFNGQTIKEQAKRIVCMSSTQIAMLDMVDCEDRVVGVSGIQFISNKYIIDHQNTIGDVGYEGNLNYELLLTLNPDLVLIYSVNGASKMEGKLKELNIPFAYIGEYLEESPLAKAEWTLAVAEMVNRRELATRKFATIPKKYLELKSIAKNTTNKPKIMINTPYGDAWVMAPNGSYMAQLIADAGGNYIYSNNNSSTKSKAIDLEEAYLMAAKSDYWINLGTINSLNELKNQYPKFADIPCVKNAKVYNSNKKLNPSGGDDYWESGVVNPHIILRDLITIFHPELSKDSLVYYKQL